MCDALSWIPCFQPYKYLGQFSLQARIHPLIPYAIFATLAFFASCACLLLPETTGQPTQEVISEPRRAVQELKLSDINEPSNVVENKTLV